LLGLGVAVEVRRNAVVDRIARSAESFDPQTQTFESCGLWTMWLGLAVRSITASAWLDLYSVAR
jgi:hypothetical protein